MAFFLGASVMTFFELVDLLICRCSRRRGGGSTSSPSTSSRLAGVRHRNRKRSRRKPATSTATGGGSGAPGAENSNHVFFRPVECSLPLPLPDESNGLSMTSLPGGGDGIGSLNHRYPPPSSVSRSQPSSLHGTGCATLPHVKPTNDIGYRSLKKQTRILQAETDI